MPVAIVEVMNNTGSALHYTNTKSGLKFAVHPTVPTKDGKGGAIATSRVNIDLVPFKSSNDVINITVDNGGPTFTVTDDDYKFSVDCDAKSQEWVRSISLGSDFSGLFFKYSTSQTSDHI